MRLLASVRRLALEERGIALPVSVAVLSVVMLLGAVAVQQAVSAVGGANRDSGVKRGVQAATAGLETAMRRMNTFSTEMGSSVTPCVATDGTVQLYTNTARTGGSSWFDCGWEELGNGEYYRYSVSSAVNDDDGDDGDPSNDLVSTVERKVVAVGESGGVTRRVMSNSRAFDIRLILGDYTAVADRLLLFENQGDVGSPEVQGNARSNGDIVLSHPNANIYGDATAGGSISGGERVVGEATQGAEPIEFPPVPMPRTDEVDGVVCPEPARCSNWSWSSADRRLLVSGGTAVLSGNVFSLCSLRMTNNSTLLFEPADPSQPVRVYIDSPDACHDATGSPPERSISLENSPQILSQAGMTYPVVQFYVAGDEPPTEEPPVDDVYFSNNNTNHDAKMSIYAPRSDVILENHATIVGGVMAQSVSLSNNTALLPADPDASAGFELPGPEWAEDVFRECVAAPPDASDPPDDGC